MERVDKVIGSITNLSRNDVKKYIKKKLVMVNNKIVESPKIKINPEVDIVILDGKAKK